MFSWKRRRYLLAKIRFYSTVWTNSDRNLKQWCYNLKLMWVYLIWKSFRVWKWLFLWSRQVRCHHREDWLRQRAGPDSLSSVEPPAQWVVSLELTIPATARADQPEEAGPEPVTVWAGTCLSHTLMITRQPHHVSLFKQQILKSIS